MVVFVRQLHHKNEEGILLMENVTIWGWDLTYSSNKQRFLEMVSRHFGSVASSTVRNFGVERLPLVILIAKLRGNMEIFQVRTVTHA